MNDLDREKLLGYLMNALDKDEIAQVERELLRQPELRNELAELQEELSPLTYVYESVDPPRDLARRTCDQIWAAVDKEEKIGEFLSTPAVPDRIVFLSLPVQESVETLRTKTVQNEAAQTETVPAETVQNIPSILSSSLASTPPKSVSPTVGQSVEQVQVLEEIKSVSGTSTTEDSVLTTATSASSPDRRLVRRAPTPADSKSKKSISSKASAAVESQKSKHRPGLEENASPFKSQQLKNKRLIDILTSVSVGVLIALIAFPAVNFAKNQAQSIVKQNRINELSQSAGVYAASMQNEGTPQEVAEETKSVNLSQSGWQEVVPNRIPLLNVGSNSRIDIASSPSAGNIQNTFSNQVLPAAPLYYDNRPAARNNNELFLGQAPEQLEQVEIDPKSLAYQTLISNVGQTVSLDGNMPQPPTVQTAVGQNVLFQNGRVFFRVLPVFEQNHLASGSAFQQTDHREAE